MEVVLLNMRESLSTQHRQMVLLEAPLTPPPSHKATIENISNLLPPLDPTSFIGEVDDDELTLDLNSCLQQTPSITSLVHNKAPSTPPVHQTRRRITLLPNLLPPLDNTSVSIGDENDDDEIDPVYSICPQTSVTSSSIPLRSMIHLTSPLPTHARRVTNKKTMKKLEDIDSSELLPEEEVGEHSLSYLDFDVHKLQSCDFSKTNDSSFSTVKTAPMCDNEWYGGDGCDSSEDNDDDVQSFVNCSPLPSGRSSLPRGEWLADLMINKDMNDPSYATRWVYSPDGSCHHLELDIRLLKNDMIPTNPSHYHHSSMDIKRGGSGGMVTTTTASSSSSSSSRGKLSHLIGSNPLHISSSSILDFKRRIQKMPRRFSSNC